MKWSVKLILKIKHLNNWTLLSAKKNQWRELIRTSQSKISYSCEMTHNTWPFLCQVFWAHLYLGDTSPPGENCLQWNMQIFHLLWPESISSTRTVSFTISRKQTQSNVSVILVFTLFRSAILDCIVSKYWLDSSSQLLMTPAYLEMKGFLETQRLLKVSWS